MSILKTKFVPACKDELDEMPVRDCGSKDLQDRQPLQVKNFYGQPAPSQS